MVNWSRFYNSIAGKAGDVCDRTGLPSPTPMQVREVTQRAHSHFARGTGPGSSPPPLLFLLLPRNGGTKGKDMEAILIFVIGALVAISLIGYGIASAHRTR